MSAAPPRANDMSEKRRSLWWWVGGGCLTWLLLLGLAFGIWYANGLGKFRNCYLKLRASSGQTTWVQFKGTRLRIAPSLESLPRARWVSAETAEWEHTGFPVVALLADDRKGRDPFRARFDLYGTECDIEWEVNVRGIDGARWTYLVEDTAETARRAEACLEVPAPKLRRLTLAVETQPEREDDTLMLGVGLRVTDAGEREREVTDIRRDGKSVRALLEVKDKAKRTIVSEEQPLSELGFT